MVYQSDDSAMLSQTESAIDALNERGQDFGSLFALRRRIVAVVDPELAEKYHDTTSD